MIIKKKLLFKPKKIIYKFILIFLILSLFLTGLGTYFSGNNESYIIKINNEKISYDKFQQNMMNFKINNNINDNLDINEHKLNFFKNQVLLKIIENTLLKQYAKKINLIITEEKIKKTIYEISEFNSEIGFDLNKLKSLLSDIGLSLDSFIKEIYDQLLINEIINIIDITSFLLPYEIENILLQYLQERHIKLATFDKTQEININSVSDSEAEAEYKLNSHKYVTPKKFNINYLKININDIKNKDKIIAKSKEVQEWYLKNIKKFTLPEKKRYSIIQFDSEKEAIFYLNKIKNEKDFFEIAKNKSKDIFSSVNNGDIGWIQEDFIIEEIKIANLKNKNEISKIIKSSSGYLIIMLTEIIPKVEQDLKYFYKEIENYIKEEKSIKIFNNYIEKIKILAKDNKYSFNDLKNDFRNYYINNTGWIDEKNIIDIFNSFEIDKEKLNINNINKCNFNIKLDQFHIKNDEFLVFCINDFLDKKIISFSEVKDQIKKQVLHDKFILQSKIKLKNAIIELESKNSPNIEEVMKKFGLIFLEKKTLDLFDDKSDEKLKYLIFNMKEPNYKKKSYEIFIDNEKILLVILDKITQKRINSVDKNILINQLKNKNSTLDIDALLNNLKNKSKIKSKYLDKI